MFNSVVQVQFFQVEGIFRVVLTEHVRSVAWDKVAERRGEIVRRSDPRAELCKGDVPPIAREDSY